jgi:hypothetical protein
MTKAERTQFQQFEQTLISLFLKRKEQEAKEKGLKALSIKQTEIQKEIDSMAPYQRPEGFEKNPQMAALVRSIQTVASILGYTRECSFGPKGKASKVSYSKAI